MSWEHYIEYDRKMLEEERDRYLALQRRLLCAVDNHDFDETGECHVCGEHREGARATG